MYVKTNETVYLIKKIHILKLKKKKFKFKVCNKELKNRELTDSENR